MDSEIENADRLADAEYYLNQWKCNDCGYEWKM
jgi:rubrerythrin